MDFVWQARALYPENMIWVGMHYRSPELWVAGREQRGIDYSLPFPTQKVRSSRWWWVRLKVKEIHPGMSLTKDTVDAEPGQMLGREVHCGLLRRQQQAQEIYLVKNRLNIKGEWHILFSCHYSLAICSYPVLETGWLSGWTFALNQTSHFYILKCEISLQCVIFRKPFVTKLHIHFLWNTINFPIISFFNAGPFNLP